MSASKILLYASETRDLSNGNNPFGPYLASGVDYVCCQVTYSNLAGTTNLSVSIQVSNDPADSVPVNWDSSVFSGIFTASGSIFVEQNNFPGNWVRIFASVTAGTVTALCNTTIKAIDGGAL